MGRSLGDHPQRIRYLDALRHSKSAVHPIESMTCGFSAEAPARRVHGRERERQVVARVRHDMHRGAAPARRDVQHVRPPPAAAAHPAAGRCDPEHLALHRDRPEAPRRQQPQHRRHGHRDLHLPADALLALRTAVRRLVAPLLVQSSRRHVCRLQGSRHAHHGRSRARARRRIGGCSPSGRAPIAAAFGSTPRRARWSWRAAGPSAGWSSAS